MPWGYAAAAVGSALIGADASRSASNTQADAANQASNTQLGMFNQTQQNLAPFLQHGTQGSNALNNLLLNPNGTLNTTSTLTKPFSQQDYQQSPYAAFLLQQGQDAAQNAASRSGLTGNTLKALSQYGQDIAGKDYQQQLQNYTGEQTNLYNYLNALSGSGQNAAVQQGGFGQNAANQIGANQIGAGTAQAAGQISSGIIGNNSLNSIFNNPNINWANLFGNKTPTPQQDYITPPSYNVGDTPVWEV